MEKIVFKNIEEFIIKINEDKACDEGIKWVLEQYNSGKDLEYILRNIKIRERIWSITKNYIQFERDCPWETLDGINWGYIIIKRPDLDELCNKFDGFNKFKKWPYSIALIRMNRPDLLNGWKIIT